jgi:hypothetical protein
MFQMFYLSLLYVASVTSTCFKIRSDVPHGMRVGRGGHERSPHKHVAWATFDGAAPAWPRDVGVGKQCLAIVSPCVDVGKQTATIGVRPRASSAN